MFSRLMDSQLGLAIVFGGIFFGPALGEWIFL